MENNYQIRKNRIDLIKILGMLMIYILHYVEKGRSIENENLIF